jgi:hypothetical protein
MLSLRHPIKFYLFTVFVCVSALASIALAADHGSIFDMKKNLPLDPDEEVYHDFYINVGSEVGFKKGSYVTVVRQVPVHDPVQNKQQGTLNIVIGRLQIIHVERNLAVGRQFSETTGEDRPTVEFEAIMIGDKVDLDSITAEPPGKKSKAAGVQLRSSQLKAEAVNDSATSSAVSPGASSGPAPASQAPAPSSTNPSGSKAEMPPQPPVPVGKTTQLAPLNDEPELDEEAPNSFKSRKSASPALDPMREPADHLRVTITRYDF